MEALIESTTSLGGDLITSKPSTLVTGNGSNVDRDETDDVTDDQFEMTALSGAAGGVMVTIILGAVLGNTLVIVSVRRFERLRVVANSFIVSLAVADLLVAALVMTFSALQHIAGRWLFGPVVCDIFNANDVLFSTASLLHLCCISVDRYLAVTDPFGYHRKMSPRRAVAMLAAVWTASCLLSHAPIHLGWYAVSETSNETTSTLNDDHGSSQAFSLIDSSASLSTATNELLRQTHQQPYSSSPLPLTDTIQLTTYECLFEVNIVYGIVSSCVSFWTPAFVIVFAYVKIFREARRQQARIRSLTSTSCTSTPSHHHHYTSQQRQQLSRDKNANRTSTAMTSMMTQNGVGGSGSRTNGITVSTTAYSQSDGDVVNGNQDDEYRKHDVSKPTVAIQRQCSITSRISSKLSLSQLLHPPNHHVQQQHQLAQQRRQLQRENKAARTLGIVVGAFIVCWLPFFTWYLTTTLCRAAATVSCPPTPDAVVTVLFWIGYANSALNPIIYACFNRDFRNAFRRILGCRNRNGGGRGSASSDGWSYRGESMSFGGGQINVERSQDDCCTGSSRWRRYTSVWCPAWNQRCRARFGRRLSDSTVTGGGDGTSLSTGGARAGSGTVAFYFAARGRCGDGDGRDAELRYEPMMTVA